MSYHSQINDFRNGFRTMDARRFQDESPKSAEEKALEERNAATLRGEDGGMSWGKSGETESTRERGAETIPPGAMASLGINPQQSSTTSPTPSDFGRPVKPDADRDESWNMSQISEYKIGG
jgi:hypothetical protein